MSLLQSKGNQEETPNFEFSLRRKRKSWNMRLIFWLLKRLPKALVSVSSDLEHWQKREWHILDARGPLRTKVSLVHCFTPEILIAVLLIDTWGYSGVGKSQSPAGDKCTKAWRRHIPERFERLPESLAGMIGVSLVKNFIKTRRGGCFFKYPISNKR